MKEISTQITSLTDDTGIRLIVNMKLGRSLLALIAATLVFAAIYAVFTGRRPSFFSVAPVVIFVTIPALLAFLPIFILWTRRRPDNLSLGAISIAMALATFGAFCFVGIDYISAKSANATVTVNGATSFIDGVPTEFWYEDTMKFIAACVVAAVGAGYTFGLIYARKNLSLSRTA